MAQVFSKSPSFEKDNTPSPREMCLWTSKIGRLRKPSTLWTAQPCQRCRALELGIRLQQGHRRGLQHPGSMCDACAPSPWRRIAGRRAGQWGLHLAFGRPRPSSFGLHIAGGGPLNLPVPTSGGHSSAASSATGSGVSNNVDLLDQAFDFPDVGSLVEVGGIRVSVQGDEPTTASSTTVKL